MTSVYYSARAAKAIGYLKSSTNDIEVFVEDVSAPNVWLNLLKKYLPSGVRLESVTPLGCRKRVLEACKLDQDNDGRKKLYIIDGDLSLVQGERKPNLRHLYRLRAYCVENYLINESALLDLAMLFDARITREAARIRLNYSGWQENNLSLMKGVFVSYAVSNKLLSSRIETVGFNVARLKQGRPHEDCLCPEKTRIRIIEVYRQTRRSVKRNETRDCFNAINDGLSDSDAMIIASGKDYILPLLYFRMRRLFSLSVSLEVFSSLLADKSNNNFDDYLSRRLAIICS